MRLEPAEVRGYNGALQVVQPGGYWPLPYRGSGYSLRHGDGTIRVAWQTQDILLYAGNEPQDLIEAVHEIKGALGSFRVTAHGAVITKVTPDGMRWEPRYVGHYDDDLRFPGMDLNPKDLKTGMLWTGFPWDSGEQWTVLEGGAREHLRWKHRGVPLHSTATYPDLARRYTSLRNRGGRLYFTEGGHIWMNIRLKEASDRVRNAMQGMWSKQLHNMTPEARDIFWPILQARVDASKGCFPVYIGRVNEFDSREAPWTYFGDRSYQFALAEGNAADDEEDEYHG